MLNTLLLYYFEIRKSIEFTIFLRNESVNILTLKIYYSRNDFKIQFNLFEKLTPIPSISFRLFIILEVIAISISLLSQRDFKSANNKYYCQFHDWLNWLLNNKSFILIGCLIGSLTWRRFKSDFGITVCEFFEGIFGSRLVGISIMLCRSAEFWTLT